MYYRPFNELQKSKQSIIVESRVDQRVLGAAINRSRQAHGAKVWPAPDVITLDTAIERGYDLHSLGSKNLLSDCFLLSREQERIVWTNVIAADEATHMRVPEHLARLAQAAWQLKSFWGIKNVAESGRYSPDVEAFSRWSEAFSQELKKIGAIDRASFFLNHVKNGSDLLAQGFRSLPEILRSWLCQDQFLYKANNPLDTSSFIGHVFETFEEELHEALLWAQATSAGDPNSRVVIGVESFSRHADEVHRYCSDIFGQTWSDAETPCSTEYRDVLVSYPAIQVALLVLDITPVCKWDVLSELIRHPLLKGAEQERHQRAVFDTRLRDENRHEVDLRMVIKRLDESSHCPYLLEFFRLIEASFLNKRGTKSLSHWMSDFNNILKSVGVIGLREKTLFRHDLEIQWERVCDQVTTFDSVTSPVTRREAISLLKRLLEEKSIFDGGRSAGIFIMPAEDTFIVDPTHLWVANVNSRAFVPKSGLSPFLSMREQRQFGLPGANLDQEKISIESTISMLTMLGTERHVSYSKFVGDDELVSCSPFFPILADRESSVRKRFIAPSWEQSPAKLERFSDFIGPPLELHETLPSGVGIFSDQSACPFRAFAIHRLRAFPVTEPTPGIDFREKGIAVHRILSALWARVKTLSSLRKLSVAERFDCVREIVRKEFKKKYFATPIENEIFKIEVERLTTLIQIWADFEVGLEPFQVLAQEEKVAVNIFGVPLRVKPDRIDQLENGDVRIIDYKTGSCSYNDWIGPRLSAPQLPIYALYHPLFVARSIAFAHVNLAKPDWIQLPVNDLSSAGSWSDWVARWEQDIKLLAEEILNGVATPEKGMKDVCVYCEQAASSLIEDVEDDFASARRL